MTVPPLAAGLRPLNADEAARLDWLRAQLRSSQADVSTAAGLGALLDASRAAWAGSASSDFPEGMIASLSVGLGDLLIRLAPGSAWVLHGGKNAPSPAVVDATGEAVVLPFADVRARWISGRTQWVPGYVEAAAAHLRPSTADVPQQRAGSGPAAAPTALAPAAGATGVGTGPAAPLPSRAGAGAAPLTPAVTPALRPARGDEGGPRPTRGDTGAPLPDRGTAGGPLPTRGDTGALRPAAGPIAPLAGLPTPVPGPPGAWQPQTAPGGPTAVPLPSRSAVVPAAPTGAENTSSAPRSGAGNASTASGIGAAARPASPAELASPPSSRVQSLVLRALELALDEAAVGGDDLPFALVPDGDSWHLEQVRSGGSAAARAWVSTSGATVGAVAWLDELDGEPAVYAEASEVGSPGLVVAHRYTRRQVAEPGRRHRRPRVAEPVGDLVLVGQSAPLL